MLVENVAIATGLGVKTLSFVYPSAETASLVTGLILLGWVVFDKIPTGLNSAFKTQVFTEDLPFRMGIFLISFGAASLLEYFPFPFSSLDFALIFALFLISLPYFSWKLQRYPKIAKLSLQRVLVMVKDFEKDYEKDKNSWFFRNVGSGVFFSVLCLAIFAGLLLAFNMDVLLIAFLGIWVVLNIRASTKAYREWRDLDETLIWKTFAGGGMQLGPSDLFDTLALLFGVLPLVWILGAGLSGIILVASSGAWYIILALLQLANRKMARIQKKESELPSLPPYADWALASSLLVFHLNMYLRVIDVGLPEIYANVFLGFLANGIGLYTVFLWKRKVDESKKSKRILAGSSEVRSDKAQHDRYRLYLVGFALNFPLFSLFGALGIILIAGVYGPLVLLGIFDRVEQFPQVRGMSAKGQAALKVIYLGFVVAIPFTAASYLLPNSYNYFLVAAAIALAIAMGGYWVASIRESPAP